MMEHPGAEEEEEPAELEAEQGRAEESGPAFGHARAVGIPLTVDPHLGGARADQFLCHRIRRLSRTRAAAIIEGGDLRRAGGAVLRPASRVVPLETLTLWRVPPDQDPPDLELRIIHEDEDVVVFDKPPDIAVHPSARYYATTLTQLMRRRGFPVSPRADAVQVPHPAHRLDRETSGVLLCARTRSAETLWKNRFLHGRVEKTYLALCQGEPRWQEHVADLPLMPMQGLPVRIKMGPHPDGQEARTEFQVLWRGQGRSLLWCRPRTGRTHQIRAHLAALGFPVLGDKLYGPQGDAWFARFAEDGPTPELMQALPHARHALHAAVLRAEQQVFVAPWPRDLAMLVPQAADAAHAAVAGLGSGVSSRIWAARAPAPVAMAQGNRSTM